MRPVILTLTLLGCVGLLASWVDEPKKEKELTAEERKELDTKARERISAGVKAFEAGKLDQAEKAFVEALDIHKQLHPKGDHQDLAASMNNVGFILRQQRKFTEAEPFYRGALEIARRVYPKEDRPFVASCLDSVAVVLFFQGKAAEAEPLFREALEMQRRLLPRQDHPELARSINSLALALRETGKPAESEPLFREALEMNKRLFPKRDHPDVAYGLSNVGFALLQQRKFADAEPVYRDALEMYRRLLGKRDSPNLAGVLSYLAAVLEGQGKHAEAEPLHREALEVRRRLYPKQDHPDILVNINQLASLLHGQGKDAEAEPFYREALEVLRRMHPKVDHPNVAEGLSELGISLHAQRKHAAAEPLFRESREMYLRLARGEPHASVAWSTALLATVLRDRGKLAEAESLVKDNLRLTRRLHPNRDHPDVVGALANVGLTLLEAGKYADAETLYREALAMARRLHPGRDHPVVLRRLTDLGLILRYQARLADAERLLRDALEMAKRLYPKSDHPATAESLGALGLVLRDVTKYTEAERFLRESLDMQERLHPKQDHRHTMVARGNLAMVFREQEKLADAEPLYRANLKMALRLYPNQDHPHLAVALETVGIILSERGNHAEAERYLRDALAMQKRLTANQLDPHVATTLQNLAAVLHARGKAADAESTLRESLEITQSLHSQVDHPDINHTLANLGFMVWKKGKPEDAERLFRDASRMDRSLTVAHAKAGSEGDALTMAAFRMSNRSKFLSVAELTRSPAVDVYFEMLTSKGAIAREAEYRGLLARAASTNAEAARILAEVREIRRRRAELLLAPAPADPNTREKRDEDLEMFARRIVKLEEELRPLFPTLARLDKLDKATVTDLQQVLPADAVFVDFIAWTRMEIDKDKPGNEGNKATPRYAAFVVTRDAVHWIDLKEAAPIERGVNLWREAITTAPNKSPLSELPAKVRELVWEPIREVLPAGTKVVYISPDKVLTGVPWAAIPGDKPGSILLEDFAVAVVPHGVFLLDELWPQDPPTSRPTGFLAVGGVPYGAEPEKSGLWAVAIARTRERTRGEPPADPKKSLAWDTLPGTKIEADQITARARKHELQTQVLSGPGASADRVLSELAHAKYAHIATHGFFADAQFRSVLQVDPKLFEFQRGGRERVGHGAINPMVMSGLVFAGANRPETPSRGILTGEALLDRDLSGLELAVLSACETGLGNVAGGEGVFGLQRAFHVAGTRNVVASLWKVDDAATAALMGEFYRQLWDEKKQPIEALRQAQLAVYRADPKDFKAMALRGYGKGDKEPPNIADIGKPMPGGKTNPPVLWAAFSLSGLGR